MKKLYKLVSLICVTAMLSGCGLVSTSDKSEEKKEKKNSIITINGEGVSQDIFNYYFYNSQDEILQNAGIENAEDIPDDFWTAENDGQTALETAKQNAMDSLIGDRLQYQKAKEEGITLSAAEKSQIQSKVSQVKQNQDMLAQLTQMGVDIESYEELLTESMYIQKLVLKLIEDEKIKIDETEVKDAFAADYIKAKHILIATTDTNTGSNLSDEEIAKKEATANDVLAKLKAGGDFDALMNEYSEDPGLANAPDGYVFTTGEMVQEFEDAAFALGEGKISGLVKSPYGYHIIKREPLDFEGTQEKQYMENYEYNMAIPELQTLTKNWEKDAKTEINKKVFNSIKPTITKNTK